MTPMGSPRGCEQLALGPFRGAIRVEVDAQDNIYVAGYMWLTERDPADTTHDSVFFKYCRVGLPCGPQV